jgi:hypothetical protein
MMEMVKVMELVFPQAVDYAAVKESAQAQCYIGTSLYSEINLLVGQNVLHSPKGGANLMRL